MEYVWIIANTKTQESYTVIITKTTTMRIEKDNKHHVIYVELQGQEQQQNALRRGGIWKY